MQTDRRKAVAAALDPADKYMVLATTLSVQIEGALAFYALTHADIGRLSSQEWKNPRLSYAENKFRMKTLGGLVFSYRRFAAELSILALAKAFEDLLAEARDLGCGGFNVWKNDDLHLRYHHDMRYIRALANVVKHSNSCVSDIADTGHRFLIEKCGVTPGYAVEHLKVDIPLHAYRVYWFLHLLAAHLAGVKAQRLPKSESVGFRRFRRFMLPSFLNIRLPRRR